MKIRTATLNASAIVVMIGTAAVPAQDSAMPT